jgi:succinyl-diaminopimelate desuccinylase
MARDGLLPQRAAALIVGEPTGGLPVIGHKGALWIKALITGKSAHGSMPDKGVNAISKAARVIAMVEKFFENPPEHPLMGKTTLNIGMISGGTKINMVPDKALLEMDVRTTPGQNHERIIEDLSEHLGNLAELSPIINAEAVYTEPDHPWTVRALDAVSEVLGTQAEPSFVTYFTDAAALNRAMGGPPTLLLGPGRADMAHQTDECCEISLIDSSCEMYYKIASDWLQKPDSPS